MRRRDRDRETRRRARRARDVQVVLSLRLGLTVREIADAFGISPARVCQIRAELAELGGVKN